MESKAVTTQAPANKALASFTEDSWGTENVKNQDIRLHKLLLMHGISKLVAARKATAGDLVDSSTQEKLGDDKAPVSIVPIYTWNDWIIMEEIKGKFEFKERIPYSQLNASWSKPENREFVDKGVKYRRDYAINLLFMLAKDLKTPGALPMATTIKRSGLGEAGSRLSELGFTCQQMKQPLCAYTVDFGVGSITNDKGTFFVPTMSNVRPTPDFQSVKGILRQWYDIFTSGGAKIEESDLDEEVQSASPGGAAPTPNSKDFEGQF